MPNSLFTWVRFKTWIIYIFAQLFARINGKCVPGTLINLLGCSCWLSLRLKDVGTYFSTCHSKNLQFSSLLLLLHPHLSPMRPPCGFPVSTHEHLFKCLPEHLVENRVENGIDHGTAISQPRNQMHYPSAQVLVALGAKRRQQVENEKWSPQDYKRKKHHP